jgi:hypothetical protein
MTASPYIHKYLAQMSRLSNCNLHSTHGPSVLIEGKSQIWTLHWWCTGKMACKPKCPVWPCDPTKIHAHAHAPEASHYAQAQATLQAKKLTLAVTVTEKLQCREDRSGRWSRFGRTDSDKGQLGVLWVSLCISWGSAGQSGAADHRRPSIMPVHRKPPERD